MTTGIESDAPAIAETPDGATGHGPRDEAAVRLGETVVAARNIRIMHALERIAERFDQAGVPLMVLKGAALQLLIYDRPDERPMDDLDLLVRPEDANRACVLLEGLGCLRGQPLVREDFFPRFHYEMEFIWGPVHRMKIDLHVRPFRPLRYARIVPAHALWTNARRVSVGRASVLVPSVEEMLIHLAVHAEIHKTPRAIWRADIKRLVDAHSGRIDWRRLVQTAKSWGVVLPLRRALGRVEGEWGPICPDQVRQTLLRERVGWKDRLVLWQAPRDAGHPVAHIAVDALCTPGWRFVAGYLRAALFPDAGHMGEWYGYRHRGWLTCAHLVRAAWPILRHLQPVWTRFVAIRTGPSRIHGTGVFATRDIPAGSVIARFRGNPVDRHGMYVVHSEDRGGRRQYYEVTGKLRFVNHSCRPNAKFVGFELRAVRAIVAGQEITIDYGPTACACRQTPLHGDGPRPDAPAADAA